MVKRILWLTLALALLTAVMLVLSCSPGPQNTGNNAVLNPPPTSVPGTPGGSPGGSPAGSPTPGPTPPSCAQADKPEAVWAAMDQDFKNSGLGNQYEHGFFKFGFVEDSSGNLKMYIEGRIAKFNGLVTMGTVIQRYLANGCVQKVFFAPKGTVTGHKLAVAAVASEDDLVEWFNCEPPLVLCEGGKCVPANNCPGGGFGDAAAASMTQNSASNSNSNTAANSSYSNR